MARVSVHGHCKMEISEFLSGLCWRAAHASCRPMAAAVIVLAFEGQCSWFQQKWQRVYLQSQIGT